MKSIFYFWDTFKSIIINQPGFDLYYIKESNNYTIIGKLEQLEITTIIYDSDIDAILDFETNYKNICNKKRTDSEGFLLIKNRVFSNTDGFRFRGSKFSGIANFGTVSNIDFKLNEERYINGGYLILENHNDGDSYRFQVIDIDNILGYGPNTVVDEFVDFYVDSKTGKQEPLIIDYPARIYSGLYIRLVYYSTGTLNVSVKCNLLLHWKTI